MSTTAHLLPEHNHACERARLSSCNCYCHGAGHQYDLIRRAVSCTDGGVNNLAQLLVDVHDIYGGFHTGIRDASTASRRLIPEDLAQLNLDRGRGATWVETLLVDEALHAAFIATARTSASMTEADRQARHDFVVELAEGALRIVAGDVETHNICDGHLWCSILAEANDSNATAASSAPGQVSPYARICYPRNRQARIPRGLAEVRSAGVTHVRHTLAANSLVPGLDDIARLVGAASCPDLWHHPGAVRYSLTPLVSATSWPPANTTNLALRGQFDVLEQRWTKRGNW